MKIVDNSLKFIRNGLRDRYCYLCESPNDHPLFDICLNCTNELPYKNQSCSRCARPLQSDDSPVCGVCLSQPPSYDVLLSPFDYIFPIDKFITELKFNQKLYRARTLGHLFSQFIKSKSTPLPECIIPVPLHSKRIQQRGYNQSIEIARTVAKNLGLPLNNTLCERTRNTKPQSDLDSKARVKNIKNAFNIKQQHNYKHVAVFDDVVTTANTVQELSKQLRQDGVEIIQVWSIARVSYET